MIDLFVKVTRRGPLFNRGLDKAVKVGLEDARHEVATDGVIEVRQQLAHVLKHPTGYYQRHIAERRAGLVEVVHDSGVIYGPWLAGASRRNQATRFKGYAHWRRATQALRRRAKAVTDRVLTARLGRLG